MEWFIATMMIATILNPLKVQIVENIDLVKVPETLTVERISGENRYETAIAVNHYLDHEGKNVVLASGENFPDALSAGVYANHINASLLWTRKESIPKKVQEELSRIQPEQTSGSKQ